MILEVEEKTTEYWVVAVEQDDYLWKVHMLGKTQSVWVEIDEWCEATWGAMGLWGEAPSTWKRMGPKYYFQHEKDRELFILRWS
jgi:hypothetical protein